MKLPSATDRFLRHLFAAWATAAALLASGCAVLPQDVQRTPSQAVAASAQTMLGRAVQAAAPAPKLSGLRLLAVGPSAQATLVHLAQQAQVSLDLQYYMVKADESGLHMLRLLRDAAQRGVRVRLLLDDIHTVGQDTLLLGLAATPNVEVRLFNPFPMARGSQFTRFAATLLDLRRTNRRMHNKLFIADGAMAVAGGRNIANEYFMRDQRENFVDLDVFMAGAVVRRLQRQFDQYWNSSLAYPVQSIADSRLSPRELRQRFDEATGPGTTPSPTLPALRPLLGPGIVWARAIAFADPPEKIEAAVTPVDPPMDEDDVEVVNGNMLELMRFAQQEVVVVTPYLVPGPTGIDLMRQLRERGVRFRVLTNSLAATDQPIVHLGYQRYRTDMLKLGVELHEMSPTGVKRNRRLGLFGESVGRLHAKTVVIDRRTLFVGSMNFDPRSAKHNTEMGILIHSPQLAGEVLQLMDLDKLQAAYRLRLSNEGRLQWVSREDGGELVEDTEPQIGGWTRLWLQLLAPLAPEELL